MQDGTKREAVSWKLSATFFWWFLVILDVFVCSMLLQNACKNSKTYVTKIDKDGSKMVPKPLQNRSWRGSGGHLGATLETRCFQDLIFDDFGSILGPPLGPLWGHFGHHFFDVFLKCLFDGFGLHLGSQNTSKMSPKRGSKPKAEIHRFCYYLLHFGHIQACWKLHLFEAFLELFFGMAFGTHFDDFGSLWGALLETILVTCWVSFLHRFLDPLKTSKKERGLG